MKKESSGAVSFLRRLSSPASLLGTQIWIATHYLRTTEISEFSAYKESHVERISLRFYSLLVDFASVLLRLAQVTFERWTEEKGTDKQA